MIAYPRGCGPDDRMVCGDLLLMNIRVKLMWNVILSRVYPDVRKDWQMKCNKLAVRK
jgi:uncharacterized protein YijF (DUF1287 family)